MSDDARHALAKAQKSLVASLTMNATPYGEFDRAQITATADALLQKRVRSAEQAWPELAASCGDDFRRLFLRYASENPPLADSYKDAQQFAHYLRDHKLLSEQGRIAMMSRLAWRRGFAITRVRAGIAMALRIPWCGVRIWRIGSSK